MRINKVQLKNFKRFTDLTLDGFPSDAKLVLLIGANGSGKSSVFDGFRYIQLRQKGGFKSTNREHRLSEDYYQKSHNQQIEFAISFNQGESTAKFDIISNTFTTSPFVNKLIGRSSIRIIPKLYYGGDTSKIENDEDGPTTFIEDDERFINDVNSYIQQIDNLLRGPVFKGESADTLRIFQDFIKPFNASLINIFGGDETTIIQLAEFQNANLSPATAAQLIFKKGQSRLHYDLLSHGEKQVVILLLNFIVRREQYEDAIIFIDEMDCHLNTSLQSRLLEEIVTKWIPDSSQLWTASHALGFIDYARKSEQAVILDFDNLDFDLPQTIQPQPNENLEVYEIAVPKEVIASILSDKKLVVAENKNSGLYNLALGEKSYLFLPANNNREVFLTIKEQENLIGLRDRDYLRDDEITLIEKAYPNYKILRYYTFENYLYHPENLLELKWEGFEINQYKEEITKRKNNFFVEIIGEIGEARQTYIEFKEVIKNDTVRTEFNTALKSDEFEVFYPFFNMKKYFDKSVLNKYKYQQKDLVKTNWFKSQIESILNNKRNPPEPGSH